MQRERGTLRDTNGDGYLNWRYLPANGQNPDLYGTDLHVMEEIMAHSVGSRQVSLKPWASTRTGLAATSSPERTHEQKRCPQRPRVSVRQRAGK